MQLISKSNMTDCFPNKWITLRVLLTIPAMVVNGEHSFSKLKLIKTYALQSVSYTHLDVYKRQKVNTIKTLLELERDRVCNKIEI